MDCNDSREGPKTYVITPLRIELPLRIAGVQSCWDQKKRSMDQFGGLDVSVKETSICIVDDAGKIVREVKVASEPEALLAVLKNLAYHFKRIGLEAGPLSQWLFSALAEAGLPVICVETRHMQAVLKAQINKTDRNDARAIAQMMRAGLYRASISSSLPAFRTWICFPIMRAAVSTSLT